MRANAVAFLFPCVNSALLYLFREPLRAKLSRLLPFCVSRTAAYYPAHASDARASCISRPHLNLFSCSIAKLHSCRSAIRGQSGLRRVCTGPRSRSGFLPPSWCGIFLFLTVLSGIGFYAGKYFIPFFGEQKPISLTLPTPKKSPISSMWCPTPTYVCSLFICGGGPTHQEHLSPRKFHCRCIISEPRPWPSLLHSHLSPTR